MPSPEELELRFQHFLQEVEGYLELGMPEHALRQLRKIRVEELREEHRAVYLASMGECLRSLCCFAEAIGYFEDFLKIRPKDVSVLLALAWCQKRTDRIDLAAESMKQALRIEPENAILHYNLACYNALLGQKETVIDSIRRALALDGDFRNLIAGETDFDPIRNDPVFIAAIGSELESDASPS